MKIINLLNEFKKKRDEDIEVSGDYTIAPPEMPCEKIRTLDYDFLRPISPMLKRRFEFCSSWRNAYLSQDWLSLQEINNWKSNQRLCEWVDLRKENSYPGEPLEDYPEKNIAIFSINPHEPEEVYLVWDNETAEPKIWHYFGADFYTFNSFERFLLYANGLIGDEDTYRQSV